MPQFNRTSSSINSRPEWMRALGLPPTVRWALLLSGGAAFGAVQVGPIEELISILGQPATVAGCSVGAEHALMVGEGRHLELRPMWKKEVSKKGKGWFMAHNVDIHRGLYILNPLRREMETRKAGRNLICDTRVTVTDLAKKEHRVIHLNNLPWKRRIDAAICSSCQPLIHEREQFMSRWLNDGGVKHVLPTLPDHDDYDFIAAIFCSPVGEARKRDEIPQSRIDSAVEQAFASLDVMVDSNAQHDFRRVRRWVNTPRAVFAPRSWDIIGRSFDAEREDVIGRLKEGDHMAQNPVWVSAFAGT